MSCGMTSHAYSPGHSGMVCDALVMRDGHGDSCGESFDAPVHRATDQVNRAREEVMRRFLAYYRGERP